MSKKLVIVESPSKAKTITKILGEGYEVIASNGHVVDLPKSKLGIDISDNFKPEYVVEKTKSKIVKELKDKAKNRMVYLASDPDREGEAISKHIADLLKIDGKIRIEFNEITKKAVLDAVANPRDIDMNRFNAQQARRVLDRLVGYQISPLLWKSIGYSASAGRVQSVALRLICELEDEIKAFKPEKYYTVEGFFEKNLALMLYETLGEKVDKLKDRKHLDNLALLNKKKFSVSTSQIKEKKSLPSLPFKTSSLQQSASSEIGFSPSKTMRVAQMLYSGVDLDEPTGLITYMRTDSTRVSQDAIAEAKKYISKTFGKEYFSERKAKAEKGKIQDAHECIRPTDISLTPEGIRRYLSDEQYKLYNLIYKRYLASQMSDLIYDQLELILEREGYKFRGLLNKITFDGYGRVLNSEEKFVASFPGIKKDDELELNKIDVKELETKPPARFSEASLIKRLEKEGIGRPSTYVPIIETLKTREYVKLEEKRFIPTELGFLLKDLLLTNFPKIMNISFTSKLEDNLDKVEEGKQDWLELLDNFQKELVKEIDAFKHEKKEDVPSDVQCSCGEAMVLKSGRFGKYLSCKNGHKMSVPLSAINKEEEKKGFVNLKDELKDLEKEKEGEKTDYLLNGKEAFLKKGPYGYYLEALVDEIRVKESIPKVVKVDKLERKKNQVLIADTLNRLKADRLKQEKAALPCEKCNSKMIIRDGKFGPFLSCSAYPKCKNIRRVTKEKKEDA